jgi:predicted enzyme related to lactoylglutathione lyase
LPKGVYAISLFGEDLKVSKVFYEEVFGLPIHFEDHASAVFNFGNMLVNLP